MFIMHAYNICPKAVGGALQNTANNYIVHTYNMVTYYILYIRWLLFPNQHSYILLSIIINDIDLVK